jgi:hypothetical protein
MIMANYQHNPKNQDKGGQYGGGTAVAEQAKDMGSQALDTAKDVAANVAQKAGDVASFIGKKAEDATSAVGSGIQSVGSAIREKGPQSGVIGSASSAVGSTLESSGKYLSDQGLSGIGEDLTNLIRRNPLPALLIGIAAGYLIARATATRS